jgi:hypothetical protein
MGFVLTLVSGLALEGNVVGAILVGTRRWTLVYVFGGVLTIVCGWALELGVIWSISNKLDWPVHCDLTRHIIFLIFGFVLELASIGLIVIGHMAAALLFYLVGSIGWVIGGLNEWGIVVFLFWVIGHPLCVVVDYIVRLEVMVVGGLSLEPQTFLWARMLPYNNSTNTTVTDLTDTFLVMLVRFSMEVVVPSAFGRSLHGNKSK